MKPVAWTTMPDANDWDFISGDKDPNGYIEGIWYPLYTADQLRAAQVEVLREAADCAVRYIDYPLDEADIAFNERLAFMGKHLRRMADELEKGELDEQ